MGMAELARLIGITELELRIAHGRWLIEHQPGYLGPDLETWCDRVRLTSMSVKNAKEFGDLSPGFRPGR